MERFIEIIPAPRKNLKIAIVGSRHFHDYQTMKEFMDACLAKWNCQKCTVVSGGATGADSLAERWAEERGFDIKVFVADWDKHGRSAGPIRNSMIVDYCTHVVAFPSHNCRGTQDTIRKAKNAGKPVEILYVD